MQKLLYIAYRFPDFSFAFCRFASRTLRMGEGVSAGAGVERAGVLEGVA